MLTSPFIANPTGDANGQIQCEAVFEFVLIAREAMGNSIDQKRSKFFNQSQKIFMRIPLMQKHGFAHFGRKLKLAAKGVQLSVVGRQISVVIQTALADGNDLRLTRLGLELNESRAVELAGVVGVDARRCPDLSRMGLRKSQDRGVVGQVGARCNKAFNAR